MFILCVRQEAYALLDFMSRSPYNSSTLERIGAEDYHRRHVADY